jgi:hypothetical protein
MHSTSGNGLAASSEKGIAVRATAHGNTGVFATSETGVGIDARSQSNVGLAASSEQGIAVRAAATKDTAVFATSETGVGIDARSHSNVGLAASSEQGIAVQATAHENTGVLATSEAGIGIDARSENGIGVRGIGGQYAGCFQGKVLVTSGLELPAMGITDPTGRWSGIDLRDQYGNATIQLDVVSRDIRLYGADLQLKIHLNSVDDAIELYGADQQVKIRLSGADGDIWIANADLAEDFDVTAEKMEPGTVMVLTEDGQLAPSTKAYDTRVAGVVSGAGNYRPGMVLDRQGARPDRSAVALVGKAFCCADATKAPIRVGDLLTTSDRPGFAMRASDPQLAFGAVLGKAMAPLSKGRGLIPILVALQ